ncbi:MAG: phosphoribosylaminoimidazolesuccinocarboxamide synthase, partial [Candidatus Ranarchaeia archaeon]
MFNDKTPLAEGKTKKVYKADNPENVVLFFKDDITGGDGKLHDLLPMKGKINATLTATLFSELEKHGIKTHLIKQTSPNTLLVKKLKMIPIEVVCRNIAAGSLCRRFPMLKQGEKLRHPIVEYFYKSDATHDPPLNHDIIMLLELVSEKQLQQIHDQTLKVNEILVPFLREKGLDLVDFKLEYGVPYNDPMGTPILGDELNQDAMRLWEIPSGRCLDKDLFRRQRP